MMTENRKMKISKIWLQFPYGEYKGKTFPQIVLSDPDWFFYKMEVNDFRNRGRLTEEAEEINRKAKSIRIPDPEGKDLVAEYAISGNKFFSLEIVPKSKPEHRGSTHTVREKVVNLSFPRQFQSFDKKGCYFLLKDVKKYIFGNSEIIFTKKRCEEFFNNDFNFVLD